MQFGRHVENLIANLRGLPEDYGRSRPRPAMQIDNLLEVVLERYRIGCPTPEERIIEHWREVVGERTAHRCRPERIDRQNRLVILAANSVIKQELLFQKRAILKRIQSLPDCRHISDIILSG